MKNTKDRFFEIYLKNCEPLENKTAIFTAGASGSGKTEFAEYILELEPNFIHLDIDSIREYEAASIAPNVYFFFSYNHYVDLLASRSGSSARLETQSLGAIKKMFKGY